MWTCWAAAGRPSYGPGMQVLCPHPIPTRLRGRPSGGSPPPARWTSERVKTAQDCPCEPSQGSRAALEKRALLTHFEKILEPLEGGSQLGCRGSLHFNCRVQRPPPAEHNFLHLWSISTPGPGSFVLEHPREPVNAHWLTRKQHWTVLFQTATVGPVACCWPPLTSYWLL